MTTTIYFPSIYAYADVDSEIKKGGSASVCYGWNGEAYIGAVSRARFTLKEPQTAEWREADEAGTIRKLHHIPDGGFAFNDLSK